MKPLTVVLTLIASLAVLMLFAQKPVYPRPGKNIPFGKKISPPSTDITTRADLAAASVTISNKEKKIKKKNKGSSIDIHLTRDINTLAESFPANHPANAQQTFGLLNNAVYFFAEDGIHGRELWRSDGTSGGTYMVKDIFAGGSGSSADGIITANNLLYFSAYTAESGQELWVSDGTSAGTRLLKDINPGSQSSGPNQMVLVNGNVFFVAFTNASNNQLWKTDGTEAGTQLVSDLQQSGIGENILELTGANKLAYFVAFTYSAGYQLFRSDGTENGTYLVKVINDFAFEQTAPMQLTEYDNKLFFSADDGQGRRLWTSDGTEAGTTYAPGFNDIFLRTDFMSINRNFPFRILNDLMFISGMKSPFSNVGELYSYSAKNSAGITLVKELGTETGPDLVNYVVPVDLEVVGNKLYFKVISNSGGFHDEIWTSTGESSQTKLVKTFEANAGAFIYSFYDANGKFYFVKYDNVVGNELWTSNGTDEGTYMVRDISPGKSGSLPENLTFVNGRLLFSAYTHKYGTELWSSNGTSGSTTLLKDINTTRTNSSWAGSTFFYRGIGTLGNEVVFNAVTPDLGAELYKSDGTSKGTVLLNDNYSGEAWSYPNNFISRRKVTYFINDNQVGTAIYSTNGTSRGLKRETTYINRDKYYVVNYNVADNGIIYYTLGNRLTSSQELWRSDGTSPGTYMLTDALSFYFNNYLAVLGNNVLFIGGDASHGYELWTSNGTVPGTKMVKDIHPGFSGSDPYNLFVYNNEVYFSAWDGGGTYSFWKSDGTGTGTIKLKNITGAFYFSYFNPFPQTGICVSDGTLYFSANDFGSYGAELWKTDGTTAGTTIVKDINPFFDSNPTHLTDVNGILFFTADDGVNGNEIWKSKGKSNNTLLVKDITPGFSFAGYYNLCNAGGRLFFLEPTFGVPKLWSSDGTPANTNPIEDETLNELFYLDNLIGAGDNLFFGGYTLKYGTELFAANVRANKFSANMVSPATIAGDHGDAQFDASIYPNPSRNSAVVRISGASGNVSVTITDMAGHQVWSTVGSLKSQINLPMNRLATGEYIVTVARGSDRKVLKLIKN